MMWRRFGMRGTINSVIGALSFAVLLVGARPAEHQHNQSGTNEGISKKILVSKMKQAGSPLVISRVTVDDSKDALMPTIDCTITNRSNKDIVAYAVKHEAVFSQRTGTFSGSITFDLPDDKNIMHPGDNRRVEISGVKYGEMPQSVTLSIDFVEFIDQSRWGPDSLKNGDRVDGGRAGARAEKDALLEILTSGGIEGVIHSLDSTQPEPDQTVPHSAEWIDGFRGGVGWIREVIRRKSSNPHEIEIELRRPGDLNRERR